MSVLLTITAWKVFLFVCFWTAASVVVAFIFSGVKRLERRRGP